VVTNEEKKCILDQARALIARGDEQSSQTEHWSQPEHFQINDPSPRPHFDPVRRGWARDGVPPNERPPPRSLDTSPAMPQTDWAPYIEERIEQEREFMCALLAEVVAAERKEHEKAFADAREQTHEQRQKHSRRKSKRSKS
jgi:hypothetical protein